MTMIRAWIRRYRVQLRLACRVSIAALVSLTIAQWLHLHLPLWSVLTGMIVTQMSVGRSLKATADYLSGTAGGALFGTLVAVLVPHSSEIGVLIVLALAVTPLALLAAIRPNFSVAPATAVIIILLPAITHASSTGSALDRVEEVLVGGVSGLAVSFLILPSNAHRLAIETIAEVLDQMALAARELFEGLETGLDFPSLHRIQDHIGAALARLETIDAEVEQERSARLAREPGVRPLLRTLLRLRHDFVMVGRVTTKLLPDSLRDRLREPLRDVQSGVTGVLSASAAALKTRRGSVPLDRLDAALAGYNTTAVAIRSEGLTRALAGDATEHFFAVGFVLEQTQKNLRELAEAANEWAASETR